MKAPSPRAKPDSPPGQENKPPKPPPDGGGGTPIPPPGVQHQGAIEETTRSAKDIEEADRLDRARAAQEAQKAAGGPAPPASGTEDAEVDEDEATAELRRRAERQQSEDTFEADGDAGKPT